MNRLTRDGTAEPVSRGQILRHARGQGNIHFPCSADHEQDWQPYPVDPYSAIRDDHTYIHTYISTICYSRNLGGVIPEVSTKFSLSVEMSRLTRDGTVESVSRDQILMCERVDFPCSADIEQDWQPYPVDPYSYCMCDHTLHGPHAGVIFREHIYG